MPPKKKPQRPTFRESKVFVASYPSTPQGIEDANRLAKQGRNVIEQMGKLPGAMTPGEMIHVNPNPATGHHEVWHVTEHEIPKEPNQPIAPTRKKPVRAVEPQKTVETGSVPRYLESEVKPKGPTPGDIAKRIRPR